MPRTSTDRALALGGPTMGTRWSVLTDDPVQGARAQELQESCAAAVALVDAQMSTWTADSDLMRLNAAPPDSWVPLPQGLMAVLSAGVAVSRQTGGAFEMNVGDAVRAWGFGTEPIDLGAIRAASARPRVPAMDVLELDAATGRARKSGPVALDLSGIAKGYGVDRLAETARALGLRHALCSIDGEVRALGPRRDGQAWAVGIDAPEDTSRGRHSVVALDDMAIATSGDYRHFVTVGTARLSHTMDPKRGAPLVDAPASVTVLSASCMMADAMATALMVMGAKTGAEFAGRQGISALFLLRSTDGCRSVGTGVFAVEP
jgi:thiamine biosynthesis lipoprotein